MTIGSLGAFALSMVNSFKRVISPALVMAFAALEGVALGAISKFFDSQLGDGSRSSGRYRHLRRLRRHAGGLQGLQHQGRRQVPHVVIAAVFGMVGISLMELVLGLFGARPRHLRHGGLGVLYRWPAWCSASSC